jgi:hypothetical protein
MLSLSQITAIAGARERLGEHAQQRDEVRRPAAIHPVRLATGGHLDRPNTVTCRFLPAVGIFGRIPHGVQLARTCGNRCRWVSSSAHTTDRRGSPVIRAIPRATAWSRAGSPRAVSLGRRQIATYRTRRYNVCMLACGRPRYRQIRGRLHAAEGVPGAR